MFSPGSRTRHRSRRKLKRKVYLLPGVVLMICAMYQYYQITAWLSPFGDLAQTESVAVQPQRIVLKDSKTGRVVSRTNTSFSKYLTDTENLPGSQLSPQYLSGDRGPILDILKAAGVEDLSTAETLTLPTWEQVVRLYGKDPIILGKETCEDFRRKTPLSKRFLGILGIFNSGSTAFGISLQSNCRFPDHPRNMSNDKITDVNGMLDQHPSAKHKMATDLPNFTIHEGIPKEDVLPVVLVRDPYYWMQSMCKQGYGVRWDHNSDKHCPNLVPDAFDRRRFKRLREASSVPVWMGQSLAKGPSWDSLIHYWNAWYQSYRDTKIPRLIIRFEDTLFHGREVMKQVCECGGGQLSAKHQYLLDEAKWHHEHAQNNMITAMIRYGTGQGRYKNMTNEDLAYARRHLDADLLELFRYRQHEEP